MRLPSHPHPLLYQSHEKEKITFQNSQAQQYMWVDRAKHTLYDALFSFLPVFISGPQIDSKRKTYTKSHGIIKECCK